MSPVAIIVLCVYVIILSYALLCVYKRVRQVVRCVLQFAALVVGFDICSRPLKVLFGSMALLSHLDYDTINAE